MSAKLERGRRVLIVGNNVPGFSSGYGHQLSLMIRAFQEIGCQVAQLALCLPTNTVGQYKPLTNVNLLEDPSMLVATEEEKAVIRQTTFYGRPEMQWPSTNIPKMHINRVAEDWRADLIIAFQDIFVYERDVLIAPAAVWMPLHFIPLEHKAKMSLADFDFLVGMSYFGTNFLRHYFPEKSHDMVYHARDTRIFCPKNDPAEWRSTREEMGWPLDAFVVLMVQSNSEASHRKAFEAQIYAFSKLAKRSRRRVYLHIHSDPWGNEGCADIGMLLEIFDLFPERPMYTEFGFSDAHTSRSLQPPGGFRSHFFSIAHSSDIGKIDDYKLARMYRASDVLLAATCAEGFGVPIIEAQLCGTPVVTNRTTAMSELTLFGESCQTGSWLLRRDFNSGWFHPDTDRVAEALERISQWSKDRKDKMFRKVQSQLLQRFSAEKLIQDWKEVAMGMFRKIDAMDFAESRVKQLKLSLKFCQLTVQREELQKRIQTRQEDLMRARASVDAHTQTLHAWNDMKRMFETPNIRKQRKYVSQAQREAKSLVDKSESIQVSPVVMESDGRSSVFGDVETKASDSHVPLSPAPSHREAENVTDTIDASDLRQMMESFPAAAPTMAEPVAAAVPTMAEPVAAAVPTMAEPVAAAVPTMAEPVAAAAPETARTTERVEGIVLRYGAARSSASILEIGTQGDFITKLRSEGIGKVQYEGKFTDISQLFGRFIYNDTDIHSARFPAMKVQ